MESREKELIKNYSDLVKAISSLSDGLLLFLCTNINESVRHQKSRLLVLKRSKLVLVVVSVVIERMCKCARLLFKYTKSWRRHFSKSVWQAEEWDLKSIRFG